MTLREDGFLGGRLSLLQPQTGYRAGMDAALLAAALDAKPGERLIEWGCGGGAALLSAALRLPQTELAGIERDAFALDLAQQNIARNALTGRVAALAGDVAAGFRPLGLERFDQAFSNPPFFDDESALRAPLPQRRGSYIADDGLKAWLDVLMASVRDRGKITLIDRADRLADILSGLQSKCGAFAVRPIAPRAGDPAKRVIVQAMRGGKAPLRLLAPLVLHGDDGGKHTAAAEAILRGDCALSWI